jgi:hypothetical protein
VPNRDVVAQLLARLGKPWSLVRFVADRPGHDRRYAMDGSKLASLGWTNRVAFADGLAATIDWFRANEEWWRAARSGEWDAYYERQYAGRLASADGLAGAAAGAADAGAAGAASPGAAAVPAVVEPHGHPAGTEG